MTLQREIVTEAAIGVGVAATREDLSAIHHPGCAAAMWQRKPLKGVQAWLDALPTEQLPKARVILQPNRVPGALEQICDIAGTSAGEARDALVQDVALLAETFVSLMDAPYLRLRLDVVTTNACRRFHIDAVTARLVCTYRGTGTQYGISTDGADPRRVFAVPAWSPIVLRGTLWPEHPKSGLLHRSPPIEGTGETRLVLVLDPVFDLEEEI